MKIATTQELLLKTIEYCNYISEHIVNVNKAWDIIKVKCKSFSFITDDELYFRINENIKIHDKSNLSMEEFTKYRDCFFPVEGYEKGKLGDAWEHHKTFNTHHWQTWSDLKYFHTTPYIVEMICDWMAMGMVFGDTAMSYYLEIKDKMTIEQEDHDFIFSILEAVGE